MGEDLGTSRKGSRERRGRKGEDIILGTEG